MSALVLTPGTIVVLAILAVLVYLAAHRMFARGLCDSGRFRSRRKGGRVPAAGVDQGGGVVCCAVDQAGGRRDPVQSVRQISNQCGGSVRALVPDVLRIGQGGGRGSGEKKKQAGRAGCGVVLPAMLCAAVIFCSGPRSTERRRWYCFTVFSGGTLRRAGGVRFSTLPGSALCVGLELSEL